MCTWRRCFTWVICCRCFTWLRRLRWFTCRGPPWLTCFKGSTYENLWRSMEIYESVWKCTKINETLIKVTETRVPVWGVRFILGGIDKQHLNAITYAPCVKFYGGRLIWLRRCTWLLCFAWLISCRCFAWDLIDSLHVDASHRWDASYAAHDTHFLLVEIKSATDPCRWELLGHLVAQYSTTFAVIFVFHRLLQINRQPTFPRVCFRNMSESPLKATRTQKGKDIVDFRSRVTPNMLQSNLK